MTSHTITYPCTQPVDTGEPVFFFFKGYGDHRDLHYPLRRQRQMCIRDRYYIGDRDALVEEDIIHAVEELEHEKEELEHEQEELEHMKEEVEHMAEGAQKEAAKEEMKHKEEEVHHMEEVVHKHEDQVHQLEEGTKHKHEGAVPRQGDVAPWPEDDAVHQLELQQHKEGKEGSPHPANPIQFEVGELKHRVDDLEQVISGQNAELEKLMQKLNKASRRQKSNPYAAQSKLVQEAEREFARIDMNGDGVIDRQEYLRAYMTSPQRVTR
eukprot:TRINITY_DN3914_c0_g1_i8.p1 TRINITY_DN3914_c0_g1~~TRINITY_DN3914_c0_g1_i8.p1  ORF type:complete len:267 (-),score=90.40 TRINITY_DN3914_c0_g1_i8:24-824(-)